MSDEVKSQKYRMPRGPVAAGWQMANVKRQKTFIVLVVEVVSRRRMCA